MDIQNNRYMIPRALMVSLMVLALLSVLAPPSAAHVLLGKTVAAAVGKHAWHRQWLASAAWKCTAPRMEAGSAPHGCDSAIVAPTWMPLACLAQ